MIAAEKILLISISSAIAFSACARSGKSAEDAAPNAAAQKSGDDVAESLAPADWADAAAKFVAPDGTDAGYAVLTNAPGAGVLLRLRLEGLSQGWHGVHLHQIGDCSDGADGFRASGGHVDPDGREHGLLNPEGPERADMPNIYAGADGRAAAEIFNDWVALYPSEEAAAEAGPYPLMDDDGFAIVVHANADDHMTQPIGGAGNRVACAAVTGMTSFEDK